MDFGLGGREFERLGTGEVNVGEGSTSGARFRLASSGLGMGLRAAEGGAGARRMISDENLGWVGKVEGGSS